MKTSARRIRQSHLRHLEEHYDGRPMRGDDDSEYSASEAPDDDEFDIEATIEYRHGQWSTCRDRMLESEEDRYVLRED